MEGGSAKRLVRFRPGLVRSHAFLSDAASTDKEQKVLLNMRRASELINQCTLLLSNRLKCLSLASLRVIEICKRRSHDELASRPGALPVDSGAESDGGASSRLTIIVCRSTRISRGYQVETCASLCVAAQNRRRFQGYVG